MNPKLVILLVVLLNIQSASAELAATQYGVTEFPASGDPSLHPRFIQGLLMLHNFEYEDAREVFREVRRKDPDFVMAYWGEALTHDHPLWHQKDLDAANTVLRALGATPKEQIARAPTAREQAYLKSLHLLFGQEAVDGVDGSASELARDEAYSAALKDIVSAYPDDLDAQALYALSILGTSHDGRDFNKYMRAAAVTETILDRNPRHPGALHYNIHSYDDPVHSPLGLRAADVYAGIAPAAVHALHMPAHIFFALGDYTRANALNERSWEAGLARMAAKSLPFDGQAYHSLSWLIYGRTQLGEVKNARELIATIQEQLERNADQMARMAFIVARGNFIVDTQAWSDPLLDVPVDHAGLPPYVIATDQYVSGVRYLKAGDVLGAKQILADFVSAADPDSRNRRVAAPVILEMLLHAQIDLAAGKTEQAIERLQASVRREHALSPAVGPPIPVQPTAELLGDVYLDLGRPTEAAAAYRQALTRAVNRTRSAQGLAASNSKAGLSN